ncbi:ABC transporter ATP-binding protein [Pectobacterium atrosepticum SCRI1043]|uniref:ABC transporter ATP-binding protein n=1 Tax=Pectobacterium atrosepticum (strain SCRI 1043 / ATCC BAA-672) TaxID=218491 RepID=Q6DB29_PECAS|nr:ABC transporter ATP-binding protein [Pectobacterium atrosepticum]GKV87376.1 ABC transporter ATP-binding protein [Pectobacterium carotovorum subsp. carotovorum]AIA69089.1 ABC transporter ATP-binding protein [Pectobacterium atrosepticum]AIK11994.1 ABC transporter ATP-binding protein [Pectobacterium atrosepticum]KFX13542.1 ABC transporter ATP-binding protein [Pectobacterium atrosepticum]KMK83423.1 ABC transporter ATP-binding protein [Pectobacterium atrosepticum ICMP 1526]
MSLSASLQTSAAVPVLALENVTIAYRSDDREQTVVEGVSFHIQPGEVVALVGESGSGKTTTAQAVIGLLAENGRLTRGAIRLNGVDISGWSQKRLDSVRGAQISLIPQDPTSSLNPVQTIGEQVDEILRIHQREDRQTTRQKTLALLERVGLNQPELRAKQYPHELSGGMKQRVLIAIAIALKPALIIADEPTSALDVTVQKRILDLLDELRRENGTAVLFVTHDLGVAAERADRLLVFQNGYIQEQGPTLDVLSAPLSHYARTLLANVPSLNPTPRPPRSHASDIIVSVENLVQTFPLSGRKGEHFRAVDDVSFSVARGTTHAIVGESGSGKTTTARSLLGFHHPSAGRILIDGTDITHLKGEALRQFRQKIQLVYQNPFGSLDPSQRLYDIVEEPLRNFNRHSSGQRERKIHEMFERVALPVALLSRKPRELSGGQRQRVAIARALVLEPQVLVLDEAVSALDVTVQAQILRLLTELQESLGLTYVFISHDLAVVRQIADTVSVLYHGKQLESGPVEHIFAQPGHRYTRELIEAIPGQQHPAFARSHQPPIHTESTFALNQGL